MNGAAEVMRRRLALAARTPGLDADILQALSAVSPQLECL